MRIGLAFVLLAACAASPSTGSTEPTAPNQLRGDDKADGGGPLWAGLTSYTIERYTTDPCDDGRNALGDDPVTYDEWARERAGIRNICFEVWDPGVTDWDNPDFWKQLDVEVHYRYGTSGAEQTAYVPSIDRRGNNRRYAWALDTSLDPTMYVASLPEMKVPVTIMSTSAGWVEVQADLQLWFTVNGRVLDSPSNHPFTIRYSGSVRIGQLDASATGYVLHDEVTCNGAHIGTGAGFFAADITDASAVAALTANVYYGVGVAGTAPLSITFGSEQMVAGQTLPGYVDPAGLHITPDGSTMTVTLDVYDAATGPRQLTATLTGCALAAAN